MTSPVVVSRIQNRRGTQAQFNALYPSGYNGVGGVDILVYPNILLPGELALCTDSRKVFLGNLSGEYVELAEMSASGEVLAPLTWTLNPSLSFTAIPGLDFDTTPFFQIVYSITDSLAPDWNTIGTNFSKNGQLDITAAAYRDPVTNTASGNAVLFLDTLGSISLTSSGNYYTFTPHVRIVGDGTDAAAHAVMLGSTVASFVVDNPGIGYTVPPTVTIDPPEFTTLCDEGIEINFVSPSEIYFKAKYNLTQSKIEIWYMHDFPGPLTFSTSTVRWLPF